MNRIERISAILVQLQSRSLVTARQIADSFGVSQRTIYRDIRVLEESGIPIIGSIGEGYSLLDGYKLPPLMFTKEEALAFLTAEKILEKSTDLHNFQSFSRGTNKIKALLKHLEKDYIANADTNISVVGKHTPTELMPFAITQQIIESVALKKQMSISYNAANGGISCRNIEPLGCFLSQNNWYLLAYCNLRNDYRNFRIDKIQSFLQTDFQFTKSHPTLAQYMDEHRMDKNVYEVIIRFQHSHIALVNSYKCYHGLLSEKYDDRHVDMHFRIFNLDHFARWYLSFADIGTIIQPALLREKVDLLIANLSNP